MARKQSIEEMVNEAFEEQAYINEHSAETESDDSWKEDLRAYNEEEKNKALEEERRLEMERNFAMDCEIDIWDMEDFGY